jgi:transposase
MQDDVSRLVGIDGLVVTGVVELREQLELEVEVALGAGCCRWCGHGSLLVKERPVVRVRDLPLAGRVTWLLWRKRRFHCESCERTFTETHPALPSRQRVSARFRRHLFERCRGANTALDAVRRERQRDARAKRPKGTRRSGQHVRWRPELYQARHRLLKASERLSARERRRLCDLFDRDPIHAEAWGLKEAFRHIYRASDRADAERRLDAFLLAVDDAGLPAVAAFAKGIRSWREELLCYLDEPTTNGYAEGVINKVKVIKRRAYGLPTFSGFRKRVVIACG